MKIFEKHLVKALGITAKLSVDGAIDERMKSDIASFGTALLHTGLLPAIALFSDSSTESGRRRVKLLNAIYYTLYSIEDISNISEKKTLLLNKALNEDESRREKLRRDVMDAAIAMKLAIRTFELKKLTYE